MMSGHSAPWNDFFSENSSVLGVFWPIRGLQANHGTVWKSAIFPQPGNQKRLKWSNTAYVNKRSFTLKITICVFQETKTYFCMKVIRIFNSQPVKIQHFMSLLTRKRAWWPHFFIAFLGLMLCIQTLSQRQILFVSQCQCVTLRTRWHVTDLWEYK